MIAVKLVLLQCAKKVKHFDKIGRPRNMHEIQFIEKNKFLKSEKFEEEKDMVGKKVNSICGVELTMISADAWRAEMEDHGNDIERAIAKFTVSRIEDNNGKFEGYVANLHNVPYIKICANGQVFRYQWWHDAWAESKSKFKKGHSRVSLVNSSITLERLMFTLDAIYKNEIPAEFSCLEVNVMDLSGNKNTCKKLGLVQNFSPENLEWTIKDLNRAHSWTVRKIKKVLGKKVRISANDMYLQTLVALEKFDKVEKYLEDNGFMVE